MLSEESLISPNEVLQLIENGTSDLQLIDLRPQSEFARGHLDGAFNMPTQYLFEETNLALITDPSRTTILYGQDQRSANGPWLLFRQLGYDHLKVMQGGYDFIKNPAESHIAEQARYDYPVIFNQVVKESEAALQEQPRPKVAVTKKKIVPQKKKSG